MKWEKYSQIFIEESNKANFDKAFIEGSLQYAKHLYDQKLPIIFDIEHLSRLVGYNEKYIIRSTTNTNRFYRHFTIPKKNGGIRNISEPLPNLKDIQKWILVEVLEKRDVSKFAKAYVKNKSLRSNAFFHQNKKIVLTIDIEDFFGSITKTMIFDEFLSMGYNKEVATLLSSLCTLNDSLPQGAPTSPALSNIISHSMDDRISEYCISKKISYTRYSDDLTFSGNFKVGKIIRFVESIFSEKGFRINNSKIRTRRQSQAQEVTGIIVNKKLQSPKKTRKYFRRDVYYIKKYGLEDHLSFINNRKNNYLEHLIGIGNHIYFINKDDNKTKENLNYLKEIKNSL